VKLLEKEFNLAIIGCGVIAQSHLRALKRLNNVKIVGVCDTDRKKAITASKKWKIDHYYTDFHKMLSEEKISILSILTPTSSHAPLAIEAIKHGINLVMEKPFTMTTNEAKLIINALRGSSIKLTVVYHWLFSKAMLKSLSLIRRQEIGDILSVYFQYVHNVKDDYMASDQNHWCHKTYGGRFGEMLPHPIYILQSLLGNNLIIKDTFVSKRGNTPWLHNDELHVILGSEKGLGLLYVSFNAPRSVVACDVYGTKEILKIDLNRQFLLRKGLGKYNKFAFVKDSLSEASKLVLLTIENALKYSFKKAGEDSISNVYTMFMDSIRKDIEPPVTPEMAYNTVRIVEEISKDIEQKSTNEYEAIK
jgi:predicted dehydrogenase